MTEDTTYMERAIELGWQGIGRNSPNPLVGCMIVNDGAIVGEGFHYFPDVDHAETIALAKAGRKAKGATAYISVEPCCHYGRTPPCTDALNKAGITKVVYGMKDPDLRVNGGGHEALASAGIEVFGGVLEVEIREQNKFFVTAKEKDRPYILQKWAMTLDGKIATRIGDSRWISNEESRNIVHHMRNIYESILVGHSTVLTDNPHLTARVDLSKELPKEIFPAAPKDTRDPLRIVLDVLGATCTSPGCKVFDACSETLIAIAPESIWDDYRSRDGIVSANTDFLECPLKGGRIELDYLLSELVKKDIHSLIVEGGSSIHAAFLKQGIVDEVLVFIGPKIFGGMAALTPVGGGGVELVKDAWHLEDVTHLQIDGDQLIHGKVRKGAD